MILTLEILGIWIGLSFLAAAVGLPGVLKRRFDRHDTWIKEGRRLR